MRIRQGIFLGLVFIVFELIPAICLFYVKNTNPSLHALSCIFLIVIAVLAVFLTIAPAATFLMPAVKSISIKDGIVKINDDSYDLTTDSYTNVWILKSVFFALMGTVIYASDHEAGISGFYWIGPVMDPNMRKEGKEIYDILSKHKQDVWEKYSYDYLCKSSSGNVVLTLPESELRRFLGRNLILNFIPAGIFLVASLFAIHYLPVYITLSLIMLFFILRGVRQGVMHYLNSNILLSSAEVTPSGIRIGNKFYSFGDGIKIDYESRSDLLNFGDYMTVRSKDISDRYWIGLPSMCQKQQILLKYTLNMVTSYIDNYGAPDA